MPPNSGKSEEEDHFRGKPRLNDEHQRERNCERISPHEPRNSAKYRNTWRRNPRNSGRNEKKDPYLSRRSWGDNECKREHHAKMISPPYYESRSSAKYFNSSRRQQYNMPLNSYWRNEEMRSGDNERKHEHHASQHAPRRSAETFGQYARPVHNWRSGEKCPFSRRYLGDNECKREHRHDPQRVKYNYALSNSNDTKEEYRVSRKVRSGDNGNRYSCEYQYPDPPSRWDSYDYNHSNYRMCRERNLFGDEAWRNNKHRPNWQVQRKNNNIYPKDRNHGYRQKKWNCGQNSSISKEMQKLEKNIATLEKDMKQFKGSGSDRAQSTSGAVAPTTISKDDDDDRVKIEILPTKRKLRDDESVQRVRGVFPQLSNTKVNLFLAMAGKFAHDRGDAATMVITALADDPLYGENVTEVTFAAAAKVRKVNNPVSVNTPGLQEVVRLECQCCYEETGYDALVSCESGKHLFCQVCLKKHANSRVFGIGNFGLMPGYASGTNTMPNTKALGLLCMASNCTSGFCDEVLAQVLPEDVMKKYNELQSWTAIKSANMNDVIKCSNCEFGAVPDPSWPKMLFRCPQCDFKSCTECGKQYHPDVNCNQVVARNETDGRKKVEEEMTSALVRQCPRPSCKKVFLKSDGCNRMTCPCGAYVCYVCKKEIPADVNYRHFCSE